jgi:hypothetical protein
MRMLTSAVVSAMRLASLNSSSHLRLCLRRANYSHRPQEQTGRPANKPQTRHRQCPVHGYCSSCDAAVPFPVTCRTPVMRS